MTINNEYVRKWVEEIAQLCRPDAIYWCNGSEDEYERLAQQAVAEGKLKALDASWPDCYAFSTQADDSETHRECTYVCTDHVEDRADTSLWMAPEEMLGKLASIMENSMSGKILYVIPYVLGPVGSPFSQTAIEITDSIYVVLNMRILTRIGDAAWSQIGDKDDFFRGVHVTGDLDISKRYIAHFPEYRTLYAVNTEFGGYAFQGKSSLAMVMSSAVAAKEGWLAEHMMILAIENPEGEVRYIAGAFPSSSGKSNLAFMIPPAYAKGYKCYTVGDDIAWLRPGPDGRLWAINPEAGFFSVLPGVNEKSSPRAAEMIRKNTIFTNIAVSEDGLPWWEGKGTKAPDNLLNWQGVHWDMQSPYKAAHPNSRFTSPASQLTSMSPHWEDPAGVPISAIIFGGKSSLTQPLLIEAFNWQHGVFLGASLSAERDKTLERNPMGILPFLGASMGDYLRNWLSMENRLTAPPNIFRVNWFRKDEKGDFLWPGYGENFRVLEWILGRCYNELAATSTAVGMIPRAEDFNLEGIKLTQAELVNELLAIDKTAWQKETAEVETFLHSFPNLPAEIKAEIAAQKERLS